MVKPMIKRFLESLMAGILNLEKVLLGFALRHITVDPKNHKDLVNLFAEVDVLKQHELELKTKGEITWTH